MHIRHTVAEGLLLHGAALGIRTHKLGSCTVGSDYLALRNHGHRELSKTCSGAVIPTSANMNPMVYKVFPAP